MITCTTSVSEDDDSPGTHYQGSDKKLVWRAGKNGCAQVFDGRKWLQSYWTNKDLKHFPFSRLDGQPEAKEEYGEYDEWN